MWPICAGAFAYGSAVVTNRRRFIERAIVRAHVANFWRSVDPQPVSDADLGQQILRLGRIDLDLLPQLLHVYAQVMRLLDAW